VKADNKHSFVLVGIKIQHRAQLLNSLGVLADEQKDVYIDGRERQDVIDYRTDIFLPEMERLSRLESSPEWKLASAKILARIGDREIRWYTLAEFLQLQPGPGHSVAPVFLPKPSWSFTRYLRIKKALMSLMLFRYFS
jgi:hypothetical protein